MSANPRSPGVPPMRRWSRAELLLAVVLLVLAAGAWLLSGRLAMPPMRLGVLTGAHPTDAMEGMDTAPLAGIAVGLFLGTWLVMMAAMMLPGIAPFTVGVHRLMRAGGAGRMGTLALVAGYFLVWAVTGVLAYAVLLAFDAIATSSGVSTLSAVRVGAVVLLIAGVYELTPLKRVCLRHCRSPALLVLRHGPHAVRSRFGALWAGARHGGYCFGCCWALMVVLLAAGAMSLVWMGVIAAVVAVEKVHRNGEMISRVLGGLLVGVGLVLLAAPGVAAALG